MKTIDKRVRQLEDRFGSSERPRPRLRLIVRTLGSKLVLADATCGRSLCPDGTVMELVEFQDHGEGPDEISEEELDRWADGFPVQTHRSMVGCSPASDIGFRGVELGRIGAAVVEQGR